MSNENELHDLSFADVCVVSNGKFTGKTVLVIKAGVQTKYGMKAITVEYQGEHSTGEKIWVAPEQLAYSGMQDTITAEAIKEADYQQWKASKNAGIPPVSQLNKKTYFKKKEENQDDDVPF